MTIKRLVTLLAVAVISLLFLSSCKKEEKDTVIEVQDISVSPIKVDMTVGDVLTLTVSISPSDATDKTVKWSSSSPAVASVDGVGKVTAISKGTTTITAESGGCKAFCTVNVSEAFIHVTGISLDVHEMEMIEGEKTKITAAVTPENSSDKSLNWSSSDESVVTVSSEGELAAVQPGTATIKVQTSDGGFSDECVITVITSPRLILYRSIGNSVLNPNKVSSIGKLVSNTYSDGWGKMEFESAITTIGEDAFKNCNLLVEIILPIKLTSIGKGAFNNCASLSEISLPESLTEIGEEAFYLCSSLSAVEIPEAVSSIGKGAFNRCNNLESFEGKYASDDGRYLAKDGTTMAFAPSGLTSYSLPEGISSIGPATFKYCSNLKSIELPSTIELIDESAFFNCSSLGTITVNAVKPPKLGSQPFKGIDSLFTVYVPEASLLDYRNAESWRDYSSHIQAITSE